MDHPAWMVSPYGERYDLLAQRLRRAREEAGLNQTQAAEKVGLTQPLVSRIEAGQRKVDPIELAALCRTYRKAVRYFVPDMPV